MGKDSSAQHGGQPDRRQCRDSAAASRRLAPALSTLAGPHVLTITKLSEARYGAAWLQSVSLPRGGRFLAAPPSPGALSGRRILFLGDSFT